MFVFQLKVGDSLLKVALNTNQSIKLRSSVSKQPQTKLLTFKSKQFNHYQVPDGGGKL